MKVSTPETPWAGTPVGVLAYIDQMVDRARRAVLDRRRSDPNPDDPLRGLHVTDAEVDALLAAPASSTTAPDGEGFDRRLELLVARFGLSSLDVDILLTAAAPDFDPRFEAIYGYLNDDVSRRRASVRLALQLMNAPLTSIALRGRLEPDAPLLQPRLLSVGDPDRPFLSRELRIPDRVVSFLLGGCGVDDRLRPLVVPVLPGTCDERLAAALHRGVRLTYLREEPGASGRSTAATACREAGLEVLAIDAGRVAPEDAEDVIAIGARDAALMNAGLVVSPVETVAAGSRWLAAADWSSVPIILVGSSEWNPEWSPQVPFVMPLRAASAAARLAHWRRELGPAQLNGSLETAVGHFRLAPDEIARAVKFASVNAVVDATAIDGDSLRAGARAASHGRLEHLATRHEPDCRLNDLVVPHEVGPALHDLIGRVRHRELVQDAWDMARYTGRRNGVTALFTGPSGTGKTLAARVIASELGLDLYVVDLATVVDKYIGETEKNLDRVFTAAEGVNGVLLFDEADALFGKRSEVSDAKDRHANIEVAYLLQRMEHFRGVAILTSNLRGNIDAAFVRRLDFIVAFPEPDEDARLKLWRQHLPASLPLADDLDLAWLAKGFALTDGAIRNAALAAAYAAAAGGREVQMADLARAVAAEYRKLGRLCTAADFGRWHDTVVRGTA